MTVLEHSNAKLRILLLGAGRMGAICTFDHEKGEADIVRLAWFVPFWRVRIPFPAILSVEVKKRGGDLRATYSPTLRTIRGRSIGLVSRSKSEALRIARVIRAYIEGPAVSLEHIR